MRKLFVIMSILTAVVFLTSCKKEAPVKPTDVGKTYVRVQEVDENGTVQYSSIYTVIVTY